MTAVADWARNDSSVTDLVMRARNSDKQAWDTLVERYAPLIWSICHRYRLDGADADDIGQTVWLHLLDQLDRLREPAALAGWLATTTQRECIRVRRAAQRLQASGHVPDIENIPDERAPIAGQGAQIPRHHPPTKETTMRAAFLCYLTQAWTADRHRHAHRDAPARAASRASRRSCGPSCGPRVGRRVW